MDTESVTAYLGLGSNLGDRRKNLAQALKILAQHVRVTKYSSVYDTAPQENPDQSRFLNIVICAETVLAPKLLLDLAKDIEANMGRNPYPANSPRPIDIDILFYGTLIWQSPGLIIPHPKLALRSFVLIPLAEIAPHLKHPITNETAQDMIEALYLKEREIIKYEEKTDV